MDDNDVKKGLQEQFQKLPKELQKAISSVDLSEKLQQITKNEKLLIDQADGVQMETLLVLLGVQAIDDYIGNLTKNVGLDKNTALKVAHDADELIFKNVRDNLKEISQKMAVEESSEIDDKNSLSEHEKILSGIENPSVINNTEGSVSVSAMPSNKAEAAPEYIPFNKGIEIRRDMTPEIEPNTLPMANPAIIKGMYHENVSPVSNIVESKMTGPVAVPKKEINIEEKTKLPEKETPKGSSDPYREPIV